MNYGREKNVRKDNSDERCFLGYATDRKMFVLHVGYVRR